jgi:hypothetical protein
VKQSGDYDLRYYWVPHENRTKHAEVTVTDSTGTSAVTLDLTAPPDPALKNSWRSLGIFRFLDVLDGTVHVAGTAGGFLHVDAIQLVPVK